MTGTMAGQYVLEGFLEWHIPVWLRALLTRLISLGPAVAVAPNLNNKLDQWINVLESMQIPFALLPVLHFNSKEELMGKFVLSNRFQLLCWALAIIIIVVNIKLVAQFAASDHAWVRVAVAIFFVVYATLITLTIWSDLVHAAKSTIHCLTRCFPRMGMMLSGTQGRGGAGGSTMKMRKANAPNPAGNIMTTSEEQFHEELVAMVSQGQRDDGSASDPNAPPPRSNHTTSLHENSVVLFGGHGGVGYQRRPFNDTWAIPSWRVFVFGGTADVYGEGRTGGVFDNKIGVLDMGEPMRWSDPALEMRADDAMPQAREHSAICYDPEEPMESPDTWEPPVKVQIGPRDLTTTMAHYTYFLNSIAEKSLCFGPGILQEQQANSETRFMIQARNQLGENRKSGRDEFMVTVQQKVLNAEGLQIDRRSMRAWGVL
eukprot:g9315.t1